MFVLMLGFLVSPAPGQAAPAPSPKISIPQAMRCLKRAYPKHICKVDASDIIFCDGSRMAFDPHGGAHRSFQARLANASLADQMSIPYPIGKRFVPPPAVNSDPGRFRHAAFFKKMYGETSRTVRRTLGKVRWFRKRGPRRTLRVTTVNGVDRKLQAVSDALERLPKRFRDIAAKTSGTFVWRRIRGTSRLSAHSFGIAIDVGVSRSNYWKWQRRKKGAALKYRNRIPRQIVKIFERHGFIWGGKWYHFDTMHFEYRPELLDPLCNTR